MTASGVELQWGECKHTNFVNAKRIASNTAPTAIISPEDIVILIFGLFYFPV